MLPMHRSHGRQYCLGYCSDMITEVASNIGHPGLYCRRTVIKSWGPVVCPTYYEHSPQLLSLENRTKKIPSCLILHLHLYLIYIYLATKNLSDNPAAGTPASWLGFNISHIWEPGFIRPREKMFLVPIRFILGGLLYFLIICSCKCWNRQKLPVICNKRGCKKRRKTRKFSARLNNVNNISQK